jgi:tetratricopeptide (TPR) repeat protein
VKSILTAVGGYYGAIFRDMLKSPHSNRANGIEIYDALFWYYHYQKVYSKEILGKTIQSLEAAVKADPDYAIAWAMLGELYLDDKAMEFKNIDNPVEEGLKCALRSVAIDPTCQHGYQALAWAYLFHNKREESLKAAEKCVALNPNAADMLGAMGFVHICGADFEKGFELMNDSIRHNPYFPWWFNTGFVFYFLYNKKYPEALHWAEKINRPELLWDPLLKTATFGHLNRIEEASRNLEMLNQIVPDAGNQLKDIIGSFLLSPELNSEILEGVRMAGADTERKAAKIKLKE